MDFVETGVTPIGFIQTNVLFGIAVFLLATRIEIGELRNVLDQRRTLGWGITGQEIILPLLVIGGCFAVSIPFGTGTGLLLVASMPALALGALLTLLARGNVTLSLIIIFISTLLSTFLTPLTIIFWAKLHPSAAQGAALLHYTPVYSLAVALGTVLLPAVLGLWIRKILPGMMFLVPSLIRVCFLLVLVVPAGVIYNHRESMLAGFWNTGLPVIAVYLACTLFIFKLIRALDMNSSTAATLSLTTVSQNLAIAGMFAIAGLGLDSDQILVGLWWVPIQYYGGFLIACFLRYRSDSGAESL